MIRKYVATLAVAVCLVTLVASAMQFVVDSCVLSGQTVNESLRIEFTIDVDSDHMYTIDDSMAQLLQNQVHFSTEGSARVLNVSTEITPKSVSWKEGHITKTAPGALMTAQLQWDTPSDSANGATGAIYLELPSFRGITPTMHFGQYQILGDKRCLIRELTAYRTPSHLYLARFGYALVAGLPFGMLLHTIFWAFVLKREKRARIENLQTHSYDSSQTFHADPIAEWVTAMIAIGVGTFMSCMMAGISISDGFLSSTMFTVIYSIIALEIVAAILFAYLTGKSALTVKVDANAFSYMRGRNNPQWIITAWSEILTMVEKSRKYRGSTYYWIEVEFKDNRKKLKISTSIVGYPDLRNRLFGSPKN